MRYQRTIKKDVHIQGSGLHSGKQCKVVLRQAKENTGVVFHRTDKNVYIRSNVRHVLDTAYATTIGNERIKIHTVEHLLASLYALGIDNVYIEVEGPEIPIIDGSAAQITALLRSAGVKKQNEKMPYIKILKPITLYDDERKGSVTIQPYEGFKVRFRLHFEDRPFKEQRLTKDINEEVFCNEIAPARTFGFSREINWLIKKGLIKGGSLDNAILFDDAGEVVNKSHLRFSDECVRHKILDTIGDFSLIGLPLQGYIKANKSGHTMNVKFLEKMLTCLDCWEVVTEPEYMQFPIMLPKVTPAVSSMPHQIAPPMTPALSYSYV